MENLAQQLKQFQQNMNGNLPKEITDSFNKSIEDLRSKKIEKNCIQKGDRLPVFALPNENNEVITSKTLLDSNDYLIITFIRGSWCPYCNLQLKYLQQSLSKIKDKNAVLIAITPQRTEYNAVLKDKNSLAFPILYDKGNKYANKLGITFELQDFVKPIYEQIGVNLLESNGDSSYSLPIPATFVIDKDSTVVYSFVDVDYANRSDIDKILTFLK